MQRLKCLSEHLTIFGFWVNVSILKGTLVRPCVQNYCPLWMRKEESEIGASICAKKARESGRTDAPSEWAREGARRSSTAFRADENGKKEDARRVARKSESRGLWDASSDVRLGIINFIYRAKTRPPKFLRLAEYIKPTGGCLSAMTSAYFPL